MHDIPEAGHHCSLPDVRLIVVFALVLGDYFFREDANEE